MHLILQGEETSRPIVTNIEEADRDDAPELRSASQPPQDAPEISIALTVANSATGNDEDGLTEEEIQDI
jgi:hypothetical protein